MSEELIIPKRTGTYADALIAIGIADLVSDIYQSNGFIIEPNIIDSGSSFKITLPVTLNREMVDQWPGSPGYDYVKFKDPDPLAPLHFIDYEEQKAIEKQYKDYSKLIGRSKAKKKEEAIADSGAEVMKPAPELSLWKTLNVMRMGSNTYSQMHYAIRTEQTTLKDVVARRLGLEQALGRSDEKVFVSAASVIQIFNPISGKGVNRPKPDSAGASGFPDKLIDWFDEWMKFRAFEQAMLTFAKENKDTEILVLAPKDISPSSLRVIHKKVLSERIYGSAKIDIFATFSITKAIVENSEEFRGERTGLRLLRKTPRDVIGGFHQAYFKNLGTASGIMNVSFLALPGWFIINDRRDAETWLEVVEEHRKCISSLSEEKSGEVPILLEYRNFLSTGDNMDFLEFQASYASHIMRRLSEKEWVGQFSVINLGRIIMSDINLKEIIADEGFINIATAIRRATVNQQYAKGKSGKSDFEIHYGLAQDWKRKMNNKNQFVIALAEFVQRYNSENARHAEQGSKSQRPNITVNDLNRVINFIESSEDTRVVGLLLLAYGHAKSAKVENEQDINKKGELNNEG